MTPADAQHFLQSADLIHVEHRAGGGEQHGRWQQLAEHEIPHHAGEPGTSGVGFDIGAGRFHQAAVLDTGRAGAFAAAAGEAQIDMFAVGVADRLPFGDLHHLIDAPARRVHFNAQFAVGGAGVQTQAAMHAAVEIGLLRLVDLRCQS